MTKKYSLIENNIEYGTIEAESLADALAAAAADPGDYDLSGGTVWVEVSVRLSPEAVADAANEALPGAGADVRWNNEVSFDYPPDADLEALEVALAARFAADVTDLEVERDICADPGAGIVSWRPVVKAKTIDIDPPEPDCVRGRDDHEWASPHDVLGGVAENPGVWGHGGGVVIREVCRHCGAYRETDTWAQDPGTGQQGLTSVSYEDADEASLAYVLARRIVDLEEELGGEHLDAAVEAATGVTITHGYSGLHPRALIEGVDRRLDDVDDVEDVLDDIVVEYRRRQDAADAGGE